MPTDTSWSGLKAFYASRCHTKNIRFVSVYKRDDRPGNGIAAAVLFGCCEREVSAKNNRMWNMSGPSISTSFSAGDGLLNRCEGTSAEQGKKTWMKRQRTFPLLTSHLDAGEPVLRLLFQLIFSPVGQPEGACLQMTSKLRVWHHTESNFQTTLQKCLPAPSFCMFC